MTLKQRALLDVVKVLGLGMIIGSLITLAIDWFGLPIVGLAVTTAMLVYLGKIAYDMRVSQLTYEAERVERALKDRR